MATYPHGSIELTCRALLEHPRRVKHSHIAVVFDAVLDGTGTSNGNPLLYCSFRYVKKKAGESTDAGLYVITVRVSPFFFFLSSRFVNASTKDCTLPIWNARTKSDTSRNRFLTNGRYNGSMYLIHQSGARSQSVATAI